MTDRQPSLYDHLPDMLARPAHCSAKNFSELGQVQADIEAFKGPKEDKPAEEDSATATKKKRKKRTHDESVTAKTKILKLLRELDRLAPRPPKTLRPSQQLPLAGTEANVGRLGMLVEALEESQRTVRYGEGSGRKLERQQLREPVDRISKLLEKQREAIQPKRPGRLAPVDYYSYWKVQQIDLENDLNHYSRYARAVQESVTKDLDSPEASEFLRMPHISQVANEVVVFVAMLDFARELDRVLDQCHNQRGLPSDYWLRHRAEILKQFEQAHTVFRDAIKPIHLIVTAGDPEFSTNHHYQGFIAAKQNILQAEKFGQAANAIQQLKEHAFEFILGGTDKGEKGRKEVHHKLLTRIEKAYQDDQPVVAQERLQHQQRYADSVDKHGRGGAGMYRSPFEAHSLYTLNRVYEARYALLADEMYKIVKNNIGTLANPDIAAETDKPPRDAGHVGNITPRKHSPEHLRERAEFHKRLGTRHGGLRVVPDTTTPRGKGR